MKKIIIFLAFILGFTSGWLANNFYQNNQSSPISTEKQKLEKPLEVYSIEKLKTKEIQPGKLALLDVVNQSSDFNSYLFSFEFNPNPDKKETKKTTGIINIPTRFDKSLVVIMIRGFVDQKLYKSGIGTKNTSYYFAKNGFITIAPDFLGYASSDKEADNIFEARFQTYVTILSLIKTLESLSSQPNLLTTNSETHPLFKINNLQIFLWGHSNGGQIALTTLEITSKNYPTVVWAPVSKPFPYSILYYTDESTDGGKLIRSELAKFEKDYDTDKYSFTNYLDLIKAPIQIHQGQADDAVPWQWSKELNEKLKSLGIYSEYLIYPKADHNLQPNWDEAIKRSLDFFKKYLKD